MVNQSQPAPPKPLLIPRCLQLLAQDWVSFLESTRANSPYHHVLSSSPVTPQKTIGKSLSVKPKPCRLSDKLPNFQGPRGSLEWGWSGGIL